MGFTIEVISGEFSDFWFLNHVNYLKVVQEGCTMLQICFGSTKTKNRQPNYLIFCWRYTFVFLGTPPSCPGTFQRSPKFVKIPIEIVFVQKGISNFQKSSIDIYALWIIHGDYSWIVSRDVFGLSFFMAHGQEKMAQGTPGPRLFTPILQLRIIHGGSLLDHPWIIQGYLWIISWENSRYL